jgi:hypothetical protein
MTDGTARIRPRRLVFKPTVRAWRPGDLGPRGTWRTAVEFDDGTEPTVLYWQHSDDAFAYVRGVLDTYCPKRHATVAPLTTAANTYAWTPLHAPAVVRDEIARYGGAS